MLLALPASLVAQTHFCIGGDLDDLSPVAVASCQAKMAAVRTEVKQHGAPAGWHFVVVCDEAGWKQYASFSGKGAAEIVDASYSTDTQLRWTFLRADDVDLAHPEQTASLLSAALRGTPSRRENPSGTPAPSRRLNMAMAPSSSPLER